jgi:hypothetical protein
MTGWIGSALRSSFLSPLGRGKARLGLPFVATLGLEIDILEAKPQALERRTKFSRINYRKNSIVRGVTERNWTQGIESMIPIAVF